MATDSESVWEIGLVSSLISSSEIAATESFPLDRLYDEAPQRRINLRCLISFRWFCVPIHVYIFYGSLKFMFFRMSRD